MCSRQVWLKRLQLFVQNYDKDVWLDVAKVRQTGCDWEIIAKGKSSWANNLAINYLLANSEWGGEGGEMLYMVLGGELS